jgi:hypothetical protein
VRFYGGDPMTWLKRTPQAVVRAHVEMVERLQAEEAQGLAEVCAVGRALEQGDWIPRLLSRWRRVIGGVQVAKGATPGDLSAMGIGFKEVRAGV